MKSFNDYLKEAALSAKQKKIAKIAGDKDKIDAHDLAALRSGKKPVEEAKKCMDEDDMDESGLRMAAHSAHKAGKKEFEFQGKTYPVKVQKEEVEQIDELSKKTLGSYAHKATDSAIDHGISQGSIYRKDAASNSTADTHKQAVNKRLSGLKNAAKKLGDKAIANSAKRASDSHRYGASNYRGAPGGDSFNNSFKQQDSGNKWAQKAHDRISKKSGVVHSFKKIGEEVELDEGKMKELSMDLKDMSHDEFHKQYGKPKSHFDPTNFKKPVQPGHGMDRARALAQRGMQSLSKEEVERIEEKLAQLDELSPATLKSYKKGIARDLDRASDPDNYPHGTGDEAEDRKLNNRVKGDELANKKLKAKGVNPYSEEVEQIDELKDSTLQSYKDKAQNEIKNRKDSLKYYKAADSKFDGGLKDWKAKIDKRQRGVDTANKKLAKEEVSAEMSPYLKGTLAVMDEGKIDDLRDAQKLRQAEKSAYDKDFKADTSHPSVTVHKGTSYGGSAQKDDETDEKPETKEKRSAGRPSGTSTGARLKGSKKEKDDIDGREYSLHLPK
jgi:hypothetical protein